MWDSSRFTAYRTWYGKVSQRTGDDAHFDTLKQVMDNYNMAQTLRTSGRIKDPHFLMYVGTMVTQLSVMDIHQDEIDRHYAQRTN